MCAAPSTHSHTAPLTSADVDSASARELGELEPEFRHLAKVIVLRLLILNNFSKWEDASIIGESPQRRETGRDAHPAGVKPSLRRRKDGGMDQRRRSLGHAQYPRGEADMGALRGSPRSNGERETLRLACGESLFPAKEDLLRKKAIDYRSHLCEHEP